MNDHQGMPSRRIYEVTSAYMYISVIVCCCCIQWAQRNIQITREVQNFLSTNAVASRWEHVDFSYDCSEDLTKYSRLGYDTYPYQYSKVILQDKPFQVSYFYKL